MHRFAYALTLFALSTISALAAVDPVLLELVPPNAEILYGVQVQPVMATPFGKAAYARVLANNPAIDRFAGLLGLDPKRDIRELLLVTLPSARPKLARFDLILVRGNFRVDRFASVARLSGGSAVEDHGAVTISPIAGSLRQSLTLLDSSTAAIGPSTALQELKARKSAKNSFTGALAQKALNISANNDVWFASTGAPVAQLFGNRAWLPDAIVNSVHETSGGIKFQAESAALSAEAITASDSISQAASQALTLALRLVKNARTAPLREARISSSGTNVRASLTTSDAELERMLLKAAPKKTLSAGIR